MKKNFSRPFGSTMKVVVLTFAILATVALVYLLQKSVFRPMVSEDGVPIPFASSTKTSLAGSISVLGRRTIPGGGGEIELREVSFDNGEVSEILQGATPVDRIDFVVTPISSTISDGATLAQAITPGTKVFGYLYTSRSAATEREMADRLAQGEAITFSMMFPGQFFVSDEQRADGSMIANFEQLRGITFLPLSAVHLQQNARYIIISNSANTTFTARNIPICGNSQIEPLEQCDDGIHNGEMCDSVIGGSCTYCSLTCTIETVGPPDSVCGNGLITGAETCDDRNTDSGDGCSSLCAVEDGYTCEYQDMMCPPGGGACTGGRSYCTPDGTTAGGGGGSIGGGGDLGGNGGSIGGGGGDSVCGNGIIESSEQCDDQNTNSGDGCSNMCQTEDMVSWHNSALPMDANNDGSVTSADFNAVTSYLNNIPPNTTAVDPYRTPTPRYPDVNNNGSVTSLDALLISNWIASQCGNGQFQPELGEQCDDGNTINTDSCSDTCKLLSVPF